MIKYVKYKTQVQPCDQFGVICHGDLWWSNILFRSEENAMKASIEFSTWEVVDCNISDQIQHVAHWTIPDICLFSCPEQHNRWPCPLLGWSDQTNNQSLHNTTEHLDSIRNSCDVWSITASLRPVKSLLKSTYSRNENGVLVSGILITKMCEFVLIFPW